MVKTISEKFNVPKAIPSSTNEESINLKPLRKQDIKLLNALGYKLGYKLNPIYDASGWTRLITNIDWHRDDMGRCFLYCAKGSGKLFVGKSGKYIRVLSEGTYTVFNDYKDHKFELLEPECTLLVVNIC